MSWSFTISIRERFLKTKTKSNLSLNLLLKKLVFLEIKHYTNIGAVIAPKSEASAPRWKVSALALAATQTLIPEEIVVVMVADKEADIYDLFMLPRRPNSEFLIRANHDRIVRKPTQEDQQLERLQQAIGQVPPCGQLTLELRRHPEREARTATLTLRATTLQLQPPQSHPERECLKPVSVQVILAQEDNPPPGVKPVRWLLLTTLAITSFEDVVQCLRWYSYRCLIERYHYVLFHRLSS